MDQSGISLPVTAPLVATDPSHLPESVLPDEGARARRLAIAVVISRVRWAFIPLALIGVATNEPPPTNFPVFLAALLLVVVYNTALSLHSRLPERFIEPLIALAMAGDVLIVAVTMFEFASDPSDLGWAFLMLIGPAAAVLYQRRGVVLFVPPMVVALFAATLAGGQFAASNGVVGFLHKALEVIGVTVIVAALADQNERQWSNLRLINRELERLTVSDALTGVANRRLFETRFQAERVRSRRFSAPFALAIADIDQFKRVNDQHGHPVGDRVLQIVASALRSCSRDVDLLARIGGEEFAFVLPGTDEAGAAAFGERIRNAVAGIGFEGLGVTCTISVGVASSSSTPVDELLVGADRALYRAKATGRDRVETWRGEVLTAPTPAERPMSSASMRSRFENGETVDQVAAAMHVSQRVVYGVYKRWLLAKPSAG